MKTTFTTRAAAIAIAAGVAFAPAATGIVGSVAVAQESPVVNPATPGFLTIHKYLGTDPQKAGNPTGEADQDIDASFSGFEAEFTVYKINKTADGAKDINVTTNAGLVAAAGINAGQYANIQALLDAGVLTEVKSGKTTAGVWQVGQVDLGAYLVVESQPDPIENEDGTKTTIDPAAPFIAFVPMTKGNADGTTTAGDTDPGQGTTWNYDVHAYPKNYSQTGPQKSVEDKDQNSGDKQLKYTIESTVRGFQKDEESLTDYRIEDQIDPRLDITAVNVSKLVDGAWTPVEGLTPTTNDNRVVVDFENILDTINGGDKFKVEITTTVKELGEDEELIPNTAEVYENKPGEDSATEPKNTPEVKTYWGGLKFQKVDSAGTGLKDAEFSIIRVRPVTENFAETCKSINTKDKEFIEDNAVNGTQVVNDVETISKTFKSDAAGNVLITGLHVNDFEDSKPLSGDAVSAYCLVETKAPTGKELLAEAIPFQLKATIVQGDDPRTKEVETEYRKYELATVTVGDKGDGKVVNLDDTTPQLPLTGGMGIGLIAGLGALIMGAGAMWARRNSAKA